MNCPNCDQPIESGSAFCGNCGQALQSGQASNSGNQTTSTIEQVYNNPTSQAPTKNLIPTIASSSNPGVPAYALAAPKHHSGEMKALVGIICGVLGLVSALQIPLFAFIFGIAGLVLGTTTRHLSHRRMSTISIVVSSLAIIGGMGGMAYNASIDSSLETKTSHTTPTNTLTATSISTPCFDLGFADEFQIKNDDGSCDLQAFDGKSFDHSSNIFKVYANQIPGLSESRFEPTAQEAILKDIKTTLPDYTITSRGTTEFAGSPAYYAKARKESSGVVVIEAAVLHKTSQGYNLFILVHAGLGNDISLDELEAQWQWK